MEKYLIAHDLGTSGDKASLFSTEGNLVKSYTASYETHYFHKNCAEQKTEDWWQAVCMATREITRDIDPEAVLGISFSSQMQACIAVDHNGNALRPVMIWADQRAEKQVKELIAKVGKPRMYEINGHRPSASYSIEKLMWIKEHEPDIYQNTYKMLLAKDYIICRLTGAFVTDYSEASGTDAFDLKELKWSEEILKAADIEEEKQRERGKITELVLTGGGAKGDVLSQILADVLGVKLYRLDHVETATSVAAAVIAGIGVGVFEDFSVVGQFVKKEKTFTPHEEYKEFYDRQKRLFEKGYESLIDYYKMDAQV